MISQHSENIHELAVRMPEIGKYIPKNDFDLQYGKGKIGYIIDK